MDGRLRRLLAGGSRLTCAEMSPACRKPFSFLSSSLTSSAASGSNEDRRLTGRSMSRRGRPQNTAVFPLWAARV